HPDDQASCLGTYQAAFARREPFRLEYRLRRADGAFRWVLDQGAPRRGDDGAFLGYIGGCIDIDDRKQAAEALRVSEELLKEADHHKDEFLAMLAHELRNPLAPIRNAVQLLRRHGPPDAPLQAARDVIERQVLLLARLVDDLLDVSRISRGKVQ